MAQKKLFTHLNDKLRDGDNYLFNKRLKILIEQ